MARDKKEKKAALHLLNEMKVNTRVTKELVEGLKEKYGKYSFIRWINNK